MLQAGAKKRRAISMLTFLFVIAVCAALAAHERIHQLEHREAGDASHHEYIEHDHPIRAVTAPRFDTDLVLLGLVEPHEEPALLTTRPAFTPTVRSGVVCDDDVGLHDVLSVYLI